MEFLVVNLKEANPSVDVAVANMEIEIENAKKAKLKGIKFIHGYGSHGAGGVIKVEALKKLEKLKKQNKIKTFFHGTEWSLSNKSVLQFLFECPTASNDEDLNHFNSGVTIVVL